MHDGGLQRFAKYMNSKLATTSQQNLSAALSTMPGDPRYSVIFADTLTLLFEGIARTVEIHQPLVETYYGPGKLATILAFLQDECDKQSVKIFNEFRKKRCVKEKMEKVRDSVYGTSSALSATTSMTGSFSSNSGSDSKLEARELDHVLEEMALLQARSEMYFKFVRKKSFADIDSNSDSSDSNNKEMKTKIERQLLSCGLCQSVQELMSEYIFFEEFYMTHNIRYILENSYLC